MTREERIAEAIKACVNCSVDGGDFPKRHDCDGCTTAVDEEIASEHTRIAALEVENVILRMENTRLRVRIAHIQNHELHDIQNQIDQVFLQWLPKVRAANREALLPPTT